MSGASLGVHPLLCIPWCASLAVHPLLCILCCAGTGSLRTAVREMLATEPLVARFEDAPQTEGGDGCTIAYLK